MYSRRDNWLTALVGGAFGIGVTWVVITFLTPSTPIPPKVIVSTPAFILESKTDLNVPGMEGCTLFTLTNENMAWPLRVVKCNSSVSVQSNDNNTVFTR